MGKAASLGERVGAMSSHLSVDDEAGVRPWQYTLVPVHGLSDDRRVAYDCRPWSPKRGRRPLSPVSATERGPSERPSSPTHSIVHGCTHSPIQVRYGKAGTPTTYRKPRPWSAPSARIDASVPQSCSSPLPERIDSPIGGCTYPTRVPYGLVATHKKLVQTSRSRPSSMLSSPTAHCYDIVNGFVDSTGSMPPDFLRPGSGYGQASQVYEGLEVLPVYGLEHVAATQHPGVRTPRPENSPERWRTRGNAGFRAKPLYHTQGQHGFSSMLWTSPSSKSPLSYVSPLPYCFNVSMPFRSHSAHVMHDFHCWPS